MKHLTFKEIKDKKTIRTVSITQEQADVLNKKTKMTGLSYELTKGDKSTDYVTISDVNFEKATVIEAINSQEFDGVKKINGKTGNKKVQIAFDELTDEQKEIIIEYLQ